MGQSVNPIAFRLGISHFWISRQNRFNPKLLKVQLVLKKLFQKNFFKKTFSKLKIFFNSFNFYQNWKRKKIYCVVNFHCFTFFSAKFSKKICNKLQIFLKKFLARFFKFFIKSKDHQIGLSVRFSKAPSAECLVSFFSALIKKRVKARRAFIRLKKLIFKYKFLGLRVRIAGRYTRQQRAGREIFSFGMIPTATLSKYSIGYANKFLRLRNGSCGIKIWLCQKNEFLKINF
jgi:ribosomal protein S3